MAIPSSVATLAVSVVSGAVKLGKRLDEIYSEELALRSPIVLAFPNVRRDPGDQELRRALKRLLTSTKSQSPDPLAGERGRIEELRASPGTTTPELYALCVQYGIRDSIELPAFSPDAAFRAALAARSGAWNLSEEDINRYTYFVAAGPDLRKTSLGFRIGITLFDVLTEVAGQNAGALINHEPTRRLVENILTRFSQSDTESMVSWGEVLKGVLRSSLEAVVDEREALAKNSEWLERALSAVAIAREEADNGEDFVIGLLRGQGLGVLLHGVMTEGADYLSEGEADVFEGVLSSVLLEAAGRVAGATSFQEFFHDNWHTLIGAGFRSLQEHGPKLLDEDGTILKAVLTTTVGALADSFERGRPNSETLSQVVEASISVFADPEILADDVRQPWLRDLISSVARFIHDKGLRSTFSQPALESFTRDTLNVLSQYPEVLGADHDAVKNVLSKILKGMSKVDNFSVGKVADAAVANALEGIADNPRLIIDGEGKLDLAFAGALGDIAKGLAHRVASGGIASLQAESILAEVTHVIASNDVVFMRGREGLAEAIVEAVLDAADEDLEGVLVGAGIVATVRRLMHFAAAEGLLLGKSTSAIGKRINETLRAGLQEASRVLGTQLAQQDVPQVLLALIERLARGEELPISDLAAFRQVFEEITSQVNSHAA